MKKFTTIAAALFLGSIGFTASAVVTSIVPTIDPANGSVLESMPDGVNINWDGAEVAISETANGYDPGFAPEWATFKPELYVNGDLFEGEDGVIGQISWDGGIDIMFTGNNEDLSSDPYNMDIKFVIPEGSILINGDQENATLEISYQIGEGASGAAPDTTPEVTYLPDPDITPADGAVLTYPDNVILNYGEISIEPGEESPYAVVIAPGENRGKMVELYFEYTGEWNDDYTDYTEGPAYQASISWDNLTYAEDYSVITGEYTIIIESGMIANAENPEEKNKEITLTYTLKGYNGNYVLTPEGGPDYMYAPSALSAVTVAWPNSSFESYDPSIQISAIKEQQDDNAGALALAEGAAVTDGVLNPDLVTVDEATATIILDLSGLEEGTWHIEIPAGYASFNENLSTGSVQINYVIFDGLSTATLLQPTAEVITTPVPVNVTWDYTEVAPTEAGLSASLTYYVEYEPKTVAVPADLFSFSTVDKPSGDQGTPEVGPDQNPVPEAEVNEGNLLSINVVDLLEGVYGSVELTLPEGIVADAEGAINPEQTFRFTITPAFTGDYTAAYNETEETLTLKWAKANEIFINGVGAPYLENADGIVTTFVAYDTFENTMNYDGVVFSLGGLDLNGTYTLVIPEGDVYISADNVQYINTEIALEFSLIDGVFTVVTEEAPLGLGDATFNSGLYGDYLCSQYGVVNPSVQYYVDDAVAELVYVEPETGYYGGDIKAPYYYVSTYLTVPGVAEPVKVEATLASTGNEGIMSLAEEEVSSTLTFNFDALVIDWIKGEYSLYIPAGVVKSLSGELNPAQTLTFNVVTEYAIPSDANFSPMPAGDDSTGLYNSAELEAVTINYGAELTLNVGDIVYSGNGKNNAVLDTQYVTVAGEDLILDLSHLEAGTYNFEIPTGYLIVGDNAISGSKGFSYTVWEGLKEGEILQGPAPVAQYVNNIEIYYGEDIEFAVADVPAIGVYEGFYDVFNDPTFYIPATNVSIAEILYSDEAGEPAVGEIGSDNAEEIKVLYLDIESVFEGKTGDYTIVIPEGLVKNNDGSLNPLQIIEFKLRAVADIQPEFTLNGEEISILWNGVSYISNYEGVEAYLEYPDGSKEVIAMYDQMSVSGFNTVVVDLAGMLTENGAYTLVIPEGYLNLEVGNDMMINGDVMFQFEYEDGQTSAVNALNSDVKAVDGVYNLQGVKVGDSLNGLRKGIYIINGKKVFINK